MMTMIYTALALGGAITAATAPNPESVSQTLGCKPDETISFFTPEQGETLTMDVFYPDGHPTQFQRGCIVFFFGGGWRGGSPTQFHAQARYFASRGLVAVTPQYRTTGTHGNTITPRQCVEDGKRAIRYIREHASQLGIDPDKMIAGGGSAGGHVAAATAMCPAVDATPDAPASCIPNALVLMNPVYDNGPEGFGYDRVSKYWQDISPMHNIRQGLPPTLVLFGSNDIHVPVATIKAFDQKMTAARNDCETHIYEGQKHGFFNLHSGGPDIFIDVLAKTDAFLVAHGFLTGPDQARLWTKATMARHTETHIK